MEFDDYQDRARTTWLPNDPALDPYRLILGLVGESGELAERFKKLARGDNTIIPRSDIVKELGDVLWYLSMLAYEHDISLDEVAQANVEKLASRKERNILKGSGDNR